MRLELIEVAECDSFNWNGENYTQSGEYDYLYTGADGCEYSSTLTLTINNSTSLIEDIVLVIVMNGMVRF